MAAHGDEKAAWQQVNRRYIASYARASKKARCSKGRACLMNMALEQHSGISNIIAYQCRIWRGGNGMTSVASMKSIKAWHGENNGEK